MCFDNRIQDKIQKTGDKNIAVPVMFHWAPSVVSGLGAQLPSMYSFIAPQAVILVHCTCHGVVLLWPHVALLLVYLLCVLRTVTKAVVSCELLAVASLYMHSRTLHYTVWFTAVTRVYWRRGWWCDWWGRLIIRQNDGLSSTVMRPPAVTLSKI